MKSFFKTISLTLLFLPLAVSAQYTTLVELPAFDGIQDGGFDSYINAVYAMFISIAALLAVVKIIVAGVKYMFSDIVTQKSDAKNDIRGALIGLVVIVAAVVILTVINPNLTRFNLDTQELPAPAPRDNASENICEEAVCTTTNQTAGGSVTSYVVPDGNPEVIAQAVADCRSDGSNSLHIGNLTRDGSRTVDCFTITLDESNRLADSLEADLTPGQLRLYTSSVAPYLAENFNESTMYFALSESFPGNNLSTLNGICRDLLDGEIVTSPGNENYTYVCRK